MSKDFNKFRFEGLNLHDASNKYYSCNRVSDDENKIVVRFSESHLLKTQYGYALILDSSHVVFLKNWQVSINYFGCEVLLTKDFFKIKEWGDFSDNFDENVDNLSFETFVKVAKEQQEFGTRVKWFKKD